MNALASVDWASVLGTVLALKVAAGVVVNLTPTPKDDTAVAVFYRIVEVIAGIVTKQAKQ